MDFSEAIEVVAKVLAQTGTHINVNAYDGLIVKKLTASNTLGDRGHTNQTHIAITGAQMDIFPYLRADGYFTDGDKSLKRYFITKVPVQLCENNIKYLAGETPVQIQFSDGYCTTETCVLKSKRTDGSEQAELSTLSMDGIDFIAFRKLLCVGSFLIILKEQEKFSYIAYAIKPQDSDSLIKLNNGFFKKPTSTAVPVAMSSITPANIPQRVTGGHNAILYGVPGSGKSWTIKKEYCDKNSITERIVFHPDYTNGDFIGQILPVVSGEEHLVTYEFVPGPFTSILKRAYDDPSHMYILIVEEINRGNAAAIFGEIFQLLDRKCADTGNLSEDTNYPIGSSEYGIFNKNISRYVYGSEDHEIRIPANLSLIGTMNTSDQNVFTLDTAFQRRWNMRLVENSFTNVRESLSNAKILDTDVTWRKFCETINQAIIANKGRMAASEDKRLGVYFIHENEMKFDDNAIPSPGIDSIQSELNALQQQEQENLLTESGQLRLSNIRKALLHNRAFPEKVLKYLWDDAFRFNLDAIFATDSMDSLEQVIRTFVYNQGHNRFSVFKEAIRETLYAKN